MKNNYNPKFYAFLPIIVVNLLPMQQSVSGINKVVIGLLILTILLSTCIINIIGYFGFLYF